MTGSAFPEAIDPELKRSMRKTSKRRSDMEPALSGALRNYAVESAFPCRRKGYLLGESSPAVIVFRRAGEELEIDISR